MCEETRRERDRQSNYRLSRISGELQIKRKTGRRGKRQVTGHSVVAEYRKPAILETRVRPVHHQSQQQVVRRPSRTSHHMHYHGVSVSWHSPISSKSVGVRGEGGGKVLEKKRGEETGSPFGHPLHRGLSPRCGFDGAVHPILHTRLGTQSAWSAKQSDKHQCLQLRSPLISRPSAL
jgi:hypothetical protein